MHLVHVFDMQHHALIGDFESRSPPLRPRCELVPRVHPLGGQVVISPHTLSEAQPTHMSKDAGNNLQRRKVKQELQTRGALPSDLEGTR